MKIKIPNYLTIGRIIIVPIFVISFYLPGFYGDIIPLILLISLKISHGSFDKLFVIEKKANWYMYYNTSFSFLRASLIIIALIKFPILYVIIITILVVEIIKSIFALAYLIRTHKFNFAKLDKNIILRMLKYNIWVASSWIMGRIGQSLDKIILMAFDNSSLEAEEVFLFRILLSLFKFAKLEVAANISRGRLTCTGPYLGVNAK